MIVVSAALGVLASVGLYQLLPITLAIFAEDNIARFQLAVCMGLGLTCFVLYNYLHQKQVASALRESLRIGLCLDSQLLGKRIWEQDRVQKRWSDLILYVMLRRHDQWEHIDLADVDVKKELEFKGRNKILYDYLKRFDRIVRKHLEECPERCPAKEADAIREVFLEEALERNLWWIDFTSPPCKAAYARLPSRNSIYNTALHEELYQAILHDKNEGPPHLLPDNVWDGFDALYESRGTATDKQN